MFSEVKKWGNSLAVRLSKNELDEYNVKEGDRIKIIVEKIVPRNEVDLSDIPLFIDTYEKVSEDHDIYLYTKSTK
jgi:antitoxin component of MazEF toxin-antitoxin module